MGNCFIFTVKTKIKKKIKKKISKKNLSATFHTFSKCHFVTNGEGVWPASHKWTPLPTYIELLKKHEKEKIEKKNLKKKIQKKSLSRTPKKKIKKNSMSNSEKKSKKILSQTLKKN